MCSTTAHWMKNKTGAEAGAAPVRSLNFSTPSRRPHWPRSTTRTATLPFLRHDNHAVPETRHHFPSREARDLQSCLPPPKDLQGSGALRRLLRPSKCGGAPGRAPAPLGRGRRPFPPALVALARALLRACTRPRASMVCGVAHRTPFSSHRPPTLPRPGPGAAPSRAPTGTEGRAAGPPRGLPPKAETWGPGLGAWVTNP